MALHTFLFLQPIAGVVLGGWVLGEPVDSPAMVGALILIVVGILVVNLKTKPRG